jgi:hypothetical protein
MLRLHPRVEPGLGRCSCGLLYFQPSIFAVVIPLDSSLIVFILLLWFMASKDVD